MLRAQKRAEAKPIKWSRLHYPLCQSLMWTRADCRAYLKPRVPHRVPRSACVFCPYHKLYLHPSCKPLEEIDFGTEPVSERSMAGECEGMCGN
jgi:hypothetical protein